MKLAFGLYKGQLNDENFKFAKQCGASHVVVQLVDYVQGGSNPTLTLNHLNGWGRSYEKGKLWDYETLKSIKERLKAHQLQWETIENIDPAHWYDILLDGPEKEQQLEALKQTIKMLGKLGIKQLGYHFSIPGVWGWISSYNGRGHAKSIEFDKAKIDIDQAIPKGMVWNMQYDELDNSATIPSISYEEMWQRLVFFLNSMLPIAEENGLMLLAHPDDPPMPQMRGVAKLFHSQKTYEKLLTINPSPNNGFEVCMGTLQEMPDSNLYAFLASQAAANRIGYVHCRNIIGTVPNYRESFIDEGDIDMVKALTVLHKNGYNGLIIPDHTPEMSCNAPWHAGMAYAMGYLKAILSTLE